MGTFEDVLYKAKAVAETAGKKTGELVDQMRLKVDLTAAEKELAAVYEEMGRLVYEAYKKGEDTADSIEACRTRVEEQTETKMLATSIIKLMHENLSEREFQILSMRYGLDDDNPKTQQEIASTLGISRSYISRIEKQCKQIIKRKAAHLL